MTQKEWNAVDRYLTEALVRPDVSLDAALADGEAAGLPPLSVAPNQGKLLHLLARAAGARNVLEIGTLAGYSTIWLGRALPSDGRLVTLEADARNAAVARANIDRAGLAGIVEIRVGRALDTLPVLAAERPAPFDFCFIDADKRHNADYFAWALKLSRKGALIVVDNVVRAGAVADPASRDHAVLGVRGLHELIAAEPRVTATAIQTVGIKGHDGFTIALVTADS